MIAFGTEKFHFCNLFGKQIMLFGFFVRSLPATTGTGKGAALI